MGVIEHHPTTCTRSAFEESLDYFWGSSGPGLESPPVRNFPKALAVLCGKENTTLTTGQAQHKSTVGFASSESVNSGWIDNKVCVHFVQHIWWVTDYSTRVTSKPPPVGQGTKVKRVPVLRW